MSCLLVFATEMEKDGVFPNDIPQGYDCLVSGIGILSTALRLSRTFQKQSYKNAIQIGIAGAYSSSGLNIGDTVVVASDCMPEFLPWEQNTFFGFGTLPFEENLKRVKGTTVLSCAKTYDADETRGEIAQVETMEGTAFFAACKEYGVPGIQVRAISNYTAVKKSEWEIEKALLKLKDLFAVMR
ncbi:MAG: hypothetical protein LBQ87_02520 [Candidatus Fibromonas sp.]|jgi:nucleoside phosphorylase|nr:hypothetical protein [Candidatus Fibromonas sp.]